MQFICFMILFPCITCISYFDVHQGQLSVLEKAAFLLCHVSELYISCFTTAPKSKQLHFLFKAIEVGDVDYNRVRQQIIMFHV